MPPVIHIDVPWLLQRHEEVMPEQPTINDFSALVAAVARHRVDPPRLGVDSDAAWRAGSVRAGPVRARGSHGVRGM
ncbi:hypothetical protein SAMN05216533_7801 [Streptomyces sp. Ag109_O5-10]|nr:hypothetical protein SAMN05216533_7801 [Streptomyces sp. Ag109_O5-10]